jgi:hypothetical protein
VPIWSLNAQADGSKINSSPEKKVRKDAMTLLAYIRVISDANGNVRIDQNIVPNFKITKWLRIEVGYRHGERPDNISAYDHYKVELQTKFFFDRVRFIGRMSDNIVRFGNPHFSRTNYLAITETKIPLSGKMEAIANFGYEFTYQKNNIYEAIPEVSGNSDDHAIYKFGLRYKIHKGAIEGIFGTYDVFNPYLLTQPFYQISFDYELWERGTLYSYVRYQYDKSITIPFNNFLGLGVRFRLGKN